MIHVSCQPGVAVHGRLGQPDYGNGRLSQAERIKILDPGKKRNSKLIVELVRLMLIDIFSLEQTKQLQRRLLKRPVC